MKRTYAIGTIELWKGDDFLREFTVAEFEQEFGMSVPEYNDSRNGEYTAKYGYYYQTVTSY